MPSVQFEHYPEHGTTGCRIALAPDVFVGAVGVDMEDALAKAAEVAAQLSEEHPHAYHAIATALAGGVCGPQTEYVLGQVLGWGWLKKFKHALDHAKSILHKVDALAQNPAIAAVLEKLPYGPAGLAAIHTADSLAQKGFSKEAAAEIAAKALAHVGVPQAVAPEIAKFGTEFVEKKLAKEAS